jgi:hypothetical protein
MRWFYQSGHPNWAASILNAISARIHALGIAPNYLVTLQVLGRRSHRRLRLPLVMTVLDGERYLVSMLGENASWVQNALAAGGHVTLLHGRLERVRLERVPQGRCAPVLRAYLRRAPGARPHIPVSKDAPLIEFERVAGRFPVFRVLPDLTAHS